MKLLGVTHAEDLQGTQSDGILGLSPTPTSSQNSFVTEMHQNGLLNEKSFGVFIGKNPDKSYIDFGVNRKPNSYEHPIWIGLHDTSYWRVEMTSMSYGSKQIYLNTRLAVLDTGTSLIGLPRDDFVSVIMAIKQDKTLYKVTDSNYYAVKCQSPDEFEDLIINIGGHKTVINSNDFMLDFAPYCLLGLLDLGKAKFVLLGDTYMAGNYIIHDMENLRIGIYPQKMYYAAKPINPPLEISSKFRIIIMIVLAVTLILATWLLYNKYKTREIEERDVYDRL